MIDERSVEIKFNHVKSELDSILFFLKRGDTEKAIEYLEDQINTLATIKNKI